MFTTCQTRIRSSSGTKGVHVASLTASKIPANESYEVYTRPIALVRATRRTGVRKLDYALASAIGEVEGGDVYLFEENSF